MPLPEKCIPSTNAARKLAATAIAMPRWRRQRTRPDRRTLAQVAGLRAVHRPQLFPPCLHFQKRHRARRRPFSSAIREANRRRHPAGSIRRLPGGPTAAARCRQRLTFGWFHSSASLPSNAANSARKRCRARSPRFNRTLADAQVVGQLPVTPIFGVFQQQQLRVPLPHFFQRLWLPAAAAPSPTASPRGPSSRSIP